MLVRLLVRNYALIEEVELRLAPGLTVLTGETGAGKSLLVESIGLVLGHRAEGGPLLNPDQKCVVEAEFDAVDWNWLLADLTDEEREQLPDPEGDTLLLRRELSPGGRSRAFLNDSPLNLTLLRKVAGKLVDLHSQMDAQQLLDSASQTDVLDGYAGLRAQVREFATALRALRQTTDELNRIQQGEQELRRREEFLRFQLEELDKAQLDPEEEQALEQDLRVLEHAESIGQALDQTRQLLTREELGALEQVIEAVRILDKAASLDPSLAPEVDRLREMRYTLQDVEATLAERQERIDLDPAHLQKLTARHDLLTRLKLKYNCADVAGLQLLQSQLQTELNQTGSTDERLAQLTQQQQALTEQVLTLGLALQQAREAAAAELTRQVNEALPQVGLQHATFRIAFLPLTQAGGLLPGPTGERLEPTGRGLYKVDFRIQTNPGTPEGSLAQIASGGEISRIMLALKSALAGRLQLPLLIFDEIDTGISGETARKVALLMQQMAQNHQLIAITHLPQIAAAGATHLYIYKEVRGGQTYSRLRRLEDEMRVSELAQMMAGAQPGEAALAGARELLAQLAGEVA